MKKQMKIMVLALFIMFSIFNVKIIANAETVTSNATQKSAIKEKETKELVLENPKTGYTTTNLRVRKGSNTDSKILDVYDVNTEIEYVELDYDDNWVKIIYKDDYAYMHKDYISDEKTEIEKKTTATTNTTINNTTSTSYNTNSTGHLTRQSGVFYGPSGKETYYNLNMSGVISIMRSMGNNDEYWIREDGCKMLGNYIMVAADLSVHPRGSLVPTSLGMGIVCDTGGFVSNGSGVALDIATAW